MLVIGLMSGTSMDGVNAALIDTDGENNIVPFGGVFLEYDVATKAILLQAKESFNTGRNPNREEVVEAERISTEMHAIAVEKLLSHTGYDASQIGLIGYHGQTLDHQPDIKTTLQIGDGAYLAQRFGVTVINQFRQNDLNNGGQGAPFAPLYHQVLAVKKNMIPVVFINCGGIANITVINGKNYSDIQAGFDPGPGNILIDSFVSRWTDHRENMDRDGKYGLNGQVNHELLEILFEQALLNKAGYNYLLRRPPKSLDTQDIKFIDEIAQFFPKYSEPDKNLNSLQDGCATLAAFTAKCIANSTDFFIDKIPKNWIIAGGGAKNHCILRLLQQFLTMKNQSIILQTADQCELSSTFMESEMIAWMAVRSLKGLPLSVPQTTGVSKPVSGGKAHLPQKILNAEVRTLVKNNQAVLTGYHYDE